MECPRVLAGRHSTVSVSTPVCISCRLRSPRPGRVHLYPADISQPFGVNFDLRYVPYQSALLDVLHTRDTQVSGILGPSILRRMFVPVWNMVHKCMLPVSGREEGLALVVRKN
jgi:hypothetical protein